ncbi:MAG: hypothetical protein ABL897_11680 [Hyphomicrobium sp.]
MLRSGLPTALSLAATAALFLASAKADDAVKPPPSPLEMHRRAAGTDDGSGWYPAVSTLGKFSVLLPGPFNDYTIRVEDPNIGWYVTNNVGFKLPDGFEVMVSKMNGTEKSNVPDLDNLLAIIKSKSMGKDIVESKKTMIDGLPAMNVTVKGTVHSGYFSYLVEGRSLYTVAVDCPGAMAETCSEIRDKMLVSFKRSSK